MKLDWDRIWASVHAGDPELKLGPDEDAIRFWEKIERPEERITAPPSSENFWSRPPGSRAGPTPRSTTTGVRRQGACHQAAPAASASSSSGTLVFMSQPSCVPTGTLVDLPAQNVDMVWASSAPRESSSRCRPCTTPTATS